MALTIYFLLSSYIYINIFMSSLLPLTVINYHYTFPCVRAAPQYLCWRRGLSAHWGERLRRKLSPVIRHLSSYHHPTPALTLLSHCSQTALTLLSQCSHTTLTMLSHFSPFTVLILLITLISLVLALLLTYSSYFSHSTVFQTALTLLSHCSHIALTLLCLLFSLLLALILTYSSYFSSHFSFAPHFTHYHISKILSFCLTEPMADQHNWWGTL